MNGLSCIGRTRATTNTLTCTLACAIAAALCGCGALSTPKENFYTLSAETPVPAAAPPAAAPRLITVEVTLNETVDRPQLVVRAGPHRVDILEQQRWAEPLKSAIARVVAADLRRLAGDPANEELRVALDVRRFESAPGEAVEIEAAWRAVRGTRSAAATGAATIREPARGADYEDLAAAHSRALARLSEAIAQSLAAR